MPRLLALVMVVLALSLPRMAQAHFIWIETESVGKPDTPVEISLFYGEPHEFLREKSPGNRFTTKTQPTARVRLLTFSFLVEASR